MARRAVLLSLVVLGCTPPAETVAPAPRPKPQARRTAPPRTDPAIAQALHELEQSPRLHVIVLGPDAAPVHKAMLRAADGRVDRSRIRADPGAAGAPDRGVEFRFYVPPAEGAEHDTLK